MGYKKLLKKIAQFILTSQPNNFVTVKTESINYGHILKNQSIVITGGNKGIGYSIAKKCISEGANVLILGRDLDILKKAAATLGNQCKFLQFDVTQTKEYPNLFEKCKKNFRREYRLLG